MLFISRAMARRTTCLLSAKRMSLNPLKGTSLRRLSCGTARAAPLPLMEMQVVLHCTDLSPTSCEYSNQCPRPNPTPPRIEKWCSLACSRPRAITMESLDARLCCRCHVGVPVSVNIFSPVSASYCQLVRVHTFHPCTACDSNILN